jgi:hypothetical protein
MEWLMSPKLKKYAVLSMLFLAWSVLSSRANAGQAEASGALAASARLR